MQEDKKAERYERLEKQICDLLKKSNDTTAHMATVAAVLAHKMEYFFWCGFYRVETENLVVGPYQGPIACQLLPKDKGVCWTAVNRNETIIVRNVEEFPGHIACDSRSKSEIVVPIRNVDGKVVAVLDIDSKDLASFDEIDANYLEKIVKHIKID